MSSGPQTYPGASTAYWYGSKYAGSAMEVNVVVLHTTEGRTLPDYGGGAVAPTLTAVPDFAARRLRWYQHFPIDTSARALVNLPGGVETNTLNVCQVEMVGTCDPDTHAQWTRAGLAHIYWPEAPDWALAGVAEFLRWMHVEHGVPLTGPSSWPAYPSSYGATSARMTYAEWTAFEGVCGHMHVPENVHGDPGAIHFDRLIALAKGDPPTQPAPPKEEDVPSVLNKPNSIDTLLKSGRWVELAFQTDGVILTGPVVHQTMVHLLLDAPDGTRVEGQFFLTDSAGDTSDYLPSDEAGPEGCQFHANGQVLAGRQLHFKVRATSPDGSDVRLLHRVASGLYWAV
ncbi:hypothetical protein [Streptomyces sp. 3214.6]|uniref:hypothetical protein n=1 Tax=Streptomyces sp. 3214.6 TaxID=1882757 RepID=UPI00090A1C37|nr:hypothetical protein [Streptomyces sp. 3214.6]SHI68876.1 hypothetical protein SAMN05444521_8243 [Streptomyces sp. 3214.6]